MKITWETWLESRGVRLYEHALCRYVRVCLRACVFVCVCVGGGGLPYFESGGTCVGCGDLAVVSATANLPIYHTC